MNGVVLTGSSGALGRRVVARLVASHAFPTVTALDRVPSPDASTMAGVDEHLVDLLAEDLGPRLRGAGTLIHLASVFAPEQAGDPSGLDVELTRRVLGAAADAGVTQLVLVSSATVYGAHPDNPIPLTEDAPLRPNPGFRFAEDKVEIERLAERHRETHPGTEVAVLRPTATLAEDARSWVSAALLSVAGVRVGESDPPVQFLHFDDLAAATALVAEQRCDGAFNVAPDGWIPPDAMRALAGTPRPRLPVPVVGRLVSARWRLGLSTTPPEFLPWTMHPWVVANDRLRALGWSPSFTNEEAYVAGTSPGPLETLSPKRRQELAIGVAAAAVAASAAGGFALVRRLRRRG